MDLMDPKPWNEVQEEQDFRDGHICIYIYILMYIYRIIVYSRVNCHLHEIRTAVESVSCFQHRLWSPSGPETEKMLVDVPIQQGESSRLLIWMFRHRKFAKKQGHLQIYLVSSRFI